MNLVTQAQYFNKPTYDSLTQAICSLREVCESRAITKLVMPRIGSVLDRLRWEKVREIVRKEFVDTDIEIIVCFMQE